MVAAVLSHAQNFPLPDLSQRSNQLQNRIAELGRKIGLATPDKVNLKITKNSQGPCATKHTVYVPPIFLFRVEDIPEQFRLLDWSDPRLYNDTFLKEFQNFVNTALQAAGIPASRHQTSLSLLEEYLMLMHFPEFYEKAKDFIIAHELAHLLTQEKKSFFPLSTMALISLFALAYIGSLALLAIAGLPALFLIVPVIIGGTVYLICETKPPSKALQKQREIAADRKAFEALQDAEGGIYYFLVSRLQNLMYRTENNRNNFDADGNDRTDKKHPLITERIAYLKKWHIEKYPTTPRIGLLKA